VFELEASPSQWIKAQDRVAVMAPPELAALLAGVVKHAREETRNHWQDIYKLYAVRAPENGFILSVDAKQEKKHIRRRTGS